MVFFHASENFVFGMNTSVFSHAAVFLRANLVAFQLMLRKGLSERRKTAEFLQQSFFFFFQSIA
jgi:hypothetical protein